jgi:VCBS repeat-containing protein
MKTLRALTLCLTTIAVSVICPTPVLASHSVPDAVIPVVGSTAGASGANFRTEAQLHNATGTAMSGRLVFVYQGLAIQPNPVAELAYQLAPKQTIVFEDLVAAMGAEGLGSIDVFAEVGGVPLMIVRAFDDKAEAGTTGLMVPVLRIDRALEAGDKASLVVPGDLVRYRFNIGVRTLPGEGSGVAMRLVVYNAQGEQVGDQITKDFPENVFVQTPGGDFIGQPLVAGSSILVEILSGRVILYSTTSDNTTNDGSIQIDQVLNLAPVVDELDIHVTTPPSTPVTVPLAPVDPEGDPIEAIVSAGPQNGEVSIVTGEDGVFEVTYTPEGGFTGTDAFSVTFDDGNGGTTTVAFTVTISEGNRAPFALGNTYPAVEETQLSVTAPGILSNDTDPDGDPLTVVLETGPAEAVSFGLNANGSFTYTPRAGFLGVDSFTYRADDGQATSNLATVQIIVYAGNTAPTAMPDTATTDEDTPVLIDVLANDSDLETPGQVTLVGVTSTGTLGMVSVVGSQVLYDPTASAALQALAAGESAIDTFQYTIRDPMGLTGAASVSVTVTGVDDLPIAVGDGATVLEDAAATAIAVLGNDFDPDGGPITIDAVTQGTNGAVVITGGGTGLTYQPDAEFCGSDSFTYTLNGGAVATVTVTVTCVNDAPAFVKGADETVLEDAGPQTVNGWATGISSGPANEAVQTLSFEVTNNTNPGLFAEPPAISPSGDLTYTLAPDANGGCAILPCSPTATITIVLRDSGGTLNGGVDLSGSQSFSITVLPVNDAPSFTKGADETVLEDTGLHTVNGWATGMSTGPANESGQTLTFVVSNDNNLLFSVQPDVDETTGDLTYTLEANASGAATVSVSIMDNGGTLNGGANTSAVQTFTITVTDINDAPSFTKGADQTVLEDAGAQTVAGWATTLSRGPSPFEDGQTLTFVIDSNTNTALFNAGPVVDASGTLTYTPAANANGTATITLHVEDDGGTDNGGIDASGTQSFVINVTAVNDDPTAMDDSATVAEDSGATAIDVLANDDDAPDTGETLTITGVTQPAGGTVTFTAANVSFTPTANFADVTTFTYTIGDGNGGTATATVTVTVTAVNDPPVNTVPGAQTIDQLLTLTLSSGNTNLISIADLDAVTPQVTLAVTSGTLTLSGTAGLAFSTGDGTADATMTFTGTIAAINTALDGLVYDPVDTFEGDVTLAITTNDLGQTGTGGAQQDMDTVTITVTAINDPPVNALPAAQTVAEDGTLTLSTGGTNAISISDPDAGSATVQVQLTATNGTMTLSGTTGLSFVFTDGNGTGAGDGTADATMTFRGTIAAINTALDGMQFVPTPGYEGAASIQIVTSDLGNTGTGGVQTDTDTLNITVDAVNDAPVNTVPGGQTIDEDTTLTFTGGTAVSVADDAGSNPVQITLGVTNGTLTLSGLTGLSFTTGDGTADASMVFTGTLANVNAALDGMTYTPTAHYFGGDTFTITTNDQGNTGTGGALSDTDNVLITINSVNDAPTDIALSNDTIDEGQASGTAVGNLTTTDADTADTHTYTLVAGAGDTDNASFQIVGGQLQTAAVLDFETQSSYSVRIRTTDNGTGNLTYEEAFTITLNNVNEAPTDIALDNASVAENQVSGTAVGNLSTTDPDTADTFTYTLVAGTGDTDNASFAIVGNQLQTSAVFDFETKSSYTVRVRSTDAGGLLFEEAFVITVTNVNEQPTDIALDNASINENEASGTAVGNFSTTDPDAGDSFTYTLVAGTGDTDNASFAIVGSQLQSAAMFDFETKSSYSIRVRSTDAGGLLVEEQFTITIVNVPEAPVAGADAFDTIGNTLLEVDATDSEPQPKVFVSGNLLANDTDPDTGTNAGLTTTLNTATVGAVVTVNSDGTFTYVPPPGHALATDSFTYDVSDGGLTGTGTVTITLAGRVWYVKNDATAGGTGTSTAPFDTLAEAQTASVAGDTIYVFRGDGTTAGQNAGITLKANQRLIGAGVALTVPVAVNGGANPTLLLAAGTAPLIDNTSATAGIDAGVLVDATAASMPGIEIRGLNIRGNENAIDATATGANVLGVTIANNTIRGSGAGEGIDINHGSTATTSVVTISGNTWDLAGSHPGNAIDVTRTAGTVQVAVSDNTNIVSSAGGINIVGGAAANTFITGFANNTVHQNTAGAGITISNATFDATAGGNFDVVSGGNTVVGTSGDGVGTSGITLTTVSGHLNFTDLDVFASNGAGLSVTGTGALAAATGTQVTVQNASTSVINATNGPAVSVSSATLNTIFNSVTSTNSGTTGVSITNVGGTFTASGSITNATGTDFLISGGNANVTYNGTITDTTGTVVSIASTTGGTKAFGGAISNGAISLTNNTGATINFSGGLTLSTGTAAAFTATGGGPAATSGGTVNVTGSTNTLTTTTGTALNVAHTTIGASGLTFRSISANGGANGIFLQNTGTSGGLSVTGDGINTSKGGNASGGTIQNMTGADGATSGNGIYLESTQNVSLRRMQLNGFQNSAIRGFNVSGFTLQYSTISGTSGNNTGATEGAVTFGTVAVGAPNGLSGGTNLIDNCDISGAIEHNLEFYNYSAGSNYSLTVSNSDIHDNSAAGGSDGILIETGSTYAGTATFNIQSVAFDDNKSQAVQAIALGSSTIDITINNCTIQRTNQGNEGFVLSNGANADLTAHVTNNIISGIGGATIFVGQGPGNANAGTQLTAVIRGNIITHPTTSTNSAILAWLTSTVGQTSSANVLIESNTVTENSTVGTSRGIFVDTPDANTTPAFTATILNNTVSIADNNSGLQGVAVQSRRGSGCFDIRGNTVTYPNGIPAGITGIRLRQVAPGTANLEVGTSALANPANTVLTDNNPAASGGTEVLGTATVVNNSTCSAPPV